MTGLKQQFVWQCYSCDATFTEEHQLYLDSQYLDSQPLRPSAPNGWKRVFGVVVCPLHKLTVVIEPHEGEARREVVVTW